MLRVVAHQSGAVSSESVGVWLVTECTQPTGARRIATASVLAGSGIALLVRAGFGASGVRNRQNRVAEYYERTDAIRLSNAYNRAQAEELHLDDSPELERGEPLPLDVRLDIGVRFASVTLEF